MKEAPIKRMNFLQQSRSAITYATLLKVLVIWCVFLAFLFGVQVLRELNIKREMRNAKEAANALNMEKDGHLERIQRVSRLRVGLSAKEGLSAILQNRPRWSKVLKNLTDSLPSKVWLDSVSVVDSKTGDYEIEMFGKAKSQRALTNFIMRVESSGSFSGTSLVTSRLSGDKKGLLEYEISTRPTTF